MNKTQLITKVSDSTGIVRRDVELIILTSLSVMEEALEDGDYISFQEFAKIYVTRKKEQIRSNIATEGRLYMLPELNCLRISSHPKFKRRLNPEYYEAKKKRKSSEEKE